jgi:hypothetical protein
MTSLDTDHIWNHQKSIPSSGENPRLIKWWKPAFYQVVKTRVWLNGVSVNNALELLDAKIAGCGSATGQPLYKTDFTNSLLTFSWLFVFIVCQELLYCPILHQIGACDPVARGAVHWAWAAHQRTGYEAIPSHESEPPVFTAYKSSSSSESRL